MKQDAHQIQPFPQNDHSVHSTGAHLASAYPGLCRMKRLEVLVLSLDGIAVITKAFCQLCLTVCFCRIVSLTVMLYITFLLVNRSFLYRMLLILI